MLAAINGQDYANEDRRVTPVFGKDEVLSQDDIDALLAMVDTMSLPPAVPKDAIPSISKIYTIHDKPFGKQYTNWPEIIPSREFWGTRHTA